MEKSGVVNNEILVKIPVKMKTINALILFISLYIQVSSASDRMTN